MFQPVNIDKFAYRLVKPVLNNGSFHRDSDVFDNVQGGGQGG
jgi:hypothetical protein